jgi:dipeptide/tripeptide permease
MANQIRGAESAAVADETQVDAAPPEVRVGFIQRFTVLRTAARELWITFGLKFFAILSWSLMNRTIVFWLQSDVGLSDRKAGAMVSMWSAIMTLVTLLAGSFTDAVGLRRTFLFGAGVCMAARLVMATTVHWQLAIILGLMPVAVGEALLGPVMVAATKRYATTAQRSISFSIVYAIMNLSFLVAGNAFDYARKHLGEHGHSTLLGHTFSTYEVLMLLSIAAMAPVLVLSLLLRKNVEVTDEGIVFEAKKVRETPEGQFGVVMDTVVDAVKDTFRIFGGLWTQRGFIRFLVFLFFATFMRMIFFHTSYTLAPMGVRELGDGAPVGHLDTINNWLIIFLVPVVGALTQRVSAYKMVVFGCILGTASVFILAVPVHVYEPLARGWLGDLIAHRWLGVEGPVNPWYVSIALFYVAISFGEAFYSPRLYEYAAVIAPKGQEASYMALSYLPFFMAKLTVGTLSGFLLERFCPRQGAHHSEMIWWIIGATTAVAPVGLIVFRRYIQVQEAGREG